MSQVLEINIAEILRKKTGRTLPRWVVHLLQRLIHEQEINDILRRYAHLDGVDFLSALVREFDITPRWLNPEALPSDGRKFFVCNHPLGGMDGISLSYLLAERYGDVRYLVNDLLYNLHPLQSVFLPVNSYGAQRRESVLAIERVMEGGIPVGSFPAGYCSRYRDGKVQDLAWRKSFVSQAIAYRRDIVPLYFVGRNSRHFYLVDKISRMLGSKVDLATALLPDELFRGRGKTYDIIVGQAIPWQEVADWSGTPLEKAQRIRALSYELPSQFLSN